MNFEKMVEFMFSPKHQLDVVILVLIILEAIGAYDQLKIIRREEKANGLSTSLFIYLTCMFLSFFIYGIVHLKDLLLTLNGLIFIICLLIIVELVKIKALNTKEKIISLLCSLAVASLLILPQKDLIFLIILLGSVLALLDQIRELAKCCLKKIPNNVGVKLIAFHLLNNGFWAVYAHEISSWPLYTISLFNFFLILIIAILLPMNSLILKKVNS